MTERLTALFTQYNWTLENLGMMVFGLFIAELIFIVNRDSKPEDQRTKFRPGYWASQPRNWAALILTVSSSFAALALMSYLCPPGVPPVMYSFGSGAGGQALIKFALKSFGKDAGTADTKP